MKRLGILLLLSSPLWAAVAHVASGQGFCNASTFGGDIASSCSAVSTKTFTYTATSTGNAVLFKVASASAGTTGTFTLAASGWTITQIGSAYGVSGSRSAVFKAYAPNTSAATFTLTTSVANGSSYSDLIDEFSGIDATNFIDASSLSNGSSGCVASVTPVANNDGIWIACDDTVTATGSPYTKGADDTDQDVAEWKILSGGAGVSQSSNFTSSGVATWAAIAIKPLAVASVPGVSKRGKLAKLGVS